jgi:hypothetical protein
MHPSLMQEIARYRQSDLIREAERVRLAHEVSMASDRPRRRWWFRRRSELPAALPKPAYGRY